MVEQLPEKIEWDFEHIITELYKKIQELVEAVNELEKKINTEGE